MHTKEDCIEIGRRIKDARTFRDKTLSEVALGAGVAASTVQRYEAGAFTRVKLPVIQAIASALDVNPSWLSLESDEMFNDDEYPWDAIPSDVLAQLREVYGDDNEALFAAWELSLEYEEVEKPTDPKASELSKARQDLMQIVRDCPEEKLDRLTAIVQLFLADER